MHFRLSLSVLFYALCSAAPPPTIQEHVKEFRAQLERATVAKHLSAQQRAAQKQAAHYQRHQQKAQQLYAAHRQSLTQRDMMKRQVAASVGEEVDLYFDHLTRVINVHQCESSGASGGGGGGHEGRRWRGRRIHIDRVNDTICDCCDGSDEPAAAGCPTDKCGDNQDPEEDTLSRVRAWMLENGIVSRVTPRMIGGTRATSSSSNTNSAHNANANHRRYRGMVATGQIKTGDVLMRVPQHLVISRLSTSLLSKRAAGSDDGNHLEQERLVRAMKKHLDPNAYLALLLLREMNALAVVAPNRPVEEEEEEEKRKRKTGAGSHSTSSSFSSSSAYAGKRNKDLSAATTKPPPSPAYLPERAPDELLRGPWVASLPSYVKAIFHSALDWSWLQQQQPATGLLLDLSRSSQNYAVNAYHQIRSRLVDASPHLFPPRLYSLVRFSHAYTLVNSRCVAATNASDWEANGADGSDASSAQAKAAEPSTFPIIVPVADFFNHDQHARSGVEAEIAQASQKAKATADAFDRAALLANYPQFRFDAKSHEFVVHAGRNYNKGEEVFIVYGVGWSPVEGHITDGGLGSRAHFAHHYGFLPMPSADHQVPKEGAEQIRISLEYILAHDQSACGGATETGTVESWRRDLLQATGLSTRDHVSFSSKDGTLGRGSEDLALLRLWTVCPGYALHTGTRELLRATQNSEPLEKNNEVAVHWMLIKTVDTLLLDHPTSLWEDRRKVHGMIVEASRDGPDAGAENAKEGINREEEKEGVRRARVEKSPEGASSEAKKGASTEQQQQQQQRPSASLQPDLALSVQYTVWVKQSLHKVLLRSLDSVAKVYREATGEWMEHEVKRFAEGDSVSHLQHRSNVESYTHWVEELEKWHGLWRQWNENVMANMEL